MSLRTRRHRSSTAASTSTPPPSSEFTTALRETLLTISDELQDTQASTFERISRLSLHVRILRDSLASTPEKDRPKDAFRHHSGFQVILRVIRSTSGTYHPTRRAQQEKEKLFDLLHNALCLLAEVFRGHHGNRRYFKKRVEGGGWTALEQAIASIGFGGDDFDTWSENQLFGILLAFAVDDEKVVSACHDLGQMHSSGTGIPRGGRLRSTVEDERIARHFEDSSASSATQDDTGRFITSIMKNLDVRLRANKVLCNPEIAPTIIGIWRSLPRHRPLEQAPACVIVVLALSRICSFSQSNLLGLHSTGILSPLLPLAFDDGSTLSKYERRALEDLCESLMSLGLSSLDDARYLLKSKCPRAQDFLLRMTKVTKNPPHIQFDLALHGHSSIELPTLGRQFPPPSSSPGYTFCAWIYIDNFDPKTHTTIFGAYDGSRTCFCLAYLEKDTHNFILQTSSTSTKASVRFKQTVFKEKRWYHIALVHKRPRTITGSTVAMYVDGEFTERTKLQYPATPPPSNSSTESFASFTSSTTRLQAVKAFLGTPEELSERIGHGVVSSKWSLASAHLFEDTLSDDIIAVYFTLGPRYNGNYQDCLGSFQTYERGVSLALRNELLHPGKDGKSDIVTAIRDKGSMVVPEARVVLSILPTAFFGDDIQGELDLSQLVGGLSSAAVKNLYRYTHGMGTSIAVNAALPFYNDALVYPNGIASLVGGPVVIVPQALDDAMWRLGGCTAIGLKLVDNGQTPEEVLRAVEIFLDSVRGSWRNSEAMERENGYAILASLLRYKLSLSAQVSFAHSPEKESQPMSAEERDKLSFQLLSVILGFVGYNHARPMDSMINNPMAYRILLVDFDTWRKSGPVTQKLYYKQFITFAVESKNHHLNSVRLSRMKVVKRLVNALKAEAFTHDVFPFFLQAFKVLVVADLGAEVLRMLALFITYTLHQPRSSTSKTPKPKYGAGHISTMFKVSDQKSLPIRSALESKLTTSQALTKREIGRALLQIYADILCEKGNTTRIRKFATTVTNKWILHLLTENDPEVVVLATKLIARLLVNHGHIYVKKFADPSASGGFTIMQYRLKRWWDLPPLYPILFSILYNTDVAEIDFERSFELFSLSDIFRDKLIANPDVFPVIVAMIQQGLNSILHNQDDPDSPKSAGEADSKLEAPVEGSRSRSMSLTKELEARQMSTPTKDRIGGQAAVLHALIRFLSHQHSSSQNFRDFALTSDYVRLLLGVLFPAVVSADAVSPETELNSKDSALNFDGEDVIIRSTSSIGSVTIPVVRTSTVETLLDNDLTGVSMRARPLRRGSSFILLTAKRPESESVPSKARLVSNSSAQTIAPQKASSTVVEELMELVIMVFVDQVLVRKEFPGFGLPFKIPPGFQEHQAYFQSYILRNTISHLLNAIQLQGKLLEEPRIINNMARFSVHMAEAIFEGWFLGGAEPLLDFTGFLLDHFQQPEVAKVKAVRLCSQATHTISTVFLRVALLRLSEIASDNVVDEEAIQFLNKLMYWQTVFLTAEVSEGDFLKLLCYQLYGKLIDPRQKIRHAAADLWRTLLVQKPDEISAILVMSMDRSSLIVGFKKIMELDNDVFLTWAASNQDGLNKAFYGGLNRTWEDFVNQENEKTDETTKFRIVKRKEMLRQWLAQERNEADIILRHELAARLWCKNIYAAEQLKHLRNVQDMQEHLSFLQSELTKMDKDLHRTCAVFDNGRPCKWRLDETEGRNRMRLRLIPDRTILDDYQPKSKQSERKSVASLNTKIEPPSPAESMTPTPVPSSAKTIILHESKPSEDSLSGVSIMDSGRPHTQDGQESLPEDEFEFVDDPRDPRDEDGFEDRQRKVMRSLKRGDQVQHVFNISRIIGLEACEGLLILGKDCLYLIDDFFQRSDGEIVNVWDAPADERDPYVQMISGSDIKGKRSASGEQESRSWKWSEILSVSKRRFLFRDVAVEVFFADGRSYLLTALNIASRNELHAKMANKAPQLGDKGYVSEGEDSWRMEALKTADEQPVTFSSRLAGLMNSTAWNPSMRRWAKGEMSNFHYLMLVNTMAGRTFNDLTQYPVFPWIIADYTSEELDLSNPATFRDLSKPMGCQVPSRQAEFIERYNSFAEMGENNPFHYGTHYSSAMIVAGYLIRLQPFVQSYLLIQGGNFDHPDRMFYSIPGAWQSASQGTMTDVRELTPEFFYLPEFLTNSNGFNFGVRQADGASIDTVELPPWAKGDPKIFIAKNREALESPYVSAHLNQWIDLVFGSKQQGDAAVENVNVFHHLSYRGATDLDAIQDHQEKLQIISVIHNFGQTPHQVFSKPHQTREDWNARPKRLDTSVSSLTRLPFPLFDYADAITSMTYSAKLDRLTCSSAFKLNMPPSYNEKYMEWGYADNSIRCWSSDGKKLFGLFENCHQGQLSRAMFVDSKTLVTAGVDCVLSLWNVKIDSNGKSVALTPKTSLFGHRQPVSTIAVSRSFSTILSASTDGVVILWDLNRLEFVRKLASGRSVQCAQINNVSGDIMLCRGQKVALYTLNGDLILDQNVCGEADDFIYSCAFYEGVGNEWLENMLVFTGHKRGIVHCWKKTVGKNGKWCLELVKTLEHVDPRKPGERSAAAITAITPTANTVYTGDEDGKAVSFEMKKKEAK